MPAKNTNIPQYSAADLLRYATGRMPAPEMHQLEKAALEDPFLADALEGFNGAMAEHTEPVLQKQIDRLPPVEIQKEQKKVIPLWQNRIFQLAIAAAVIFGGGWWIYSLVNTPVANNNVAVNKPAAAPPAVLKNEVASPALDSNIATQPQVADSDFASSATIAQQTPLAKPNYQPTPTVSQKDQVNDEPPVTYATQAPAKASAEVADDKTNSETDASTNFTMMRRQDSTTVALQSFNEAKYKKEANSKARMSNTAVKPEYPYAFYGKVTDVKNNPVPYTNVMINGQELGTYTDVNGNFNFISQDSALSVRTRSLGYQSNSQFLKPGLSQNNIVLQEDEKMTNNLTVITQQRVERNNSNRALPIIVERDSIEGVEPAIGKMDYSLYLTNNNRISDLQLIGKQVQLKFELDKYGNATNIKVEKSSGEALDNEAIRLLKEGPKWKGKKGKKGKITLKF